MPKVTDSHRESRREQILDAALRCFAQRGVRSTTMANIIAESGLSAGAIYGYYAGKQQLVIDAARRVLQARIGEIALEAGSGPISPAKLLRTISTGFDRDGFDPGLVVQMWGEAASDPAFRDIAEGVFSEMRDHVGGHFADWAVEVRGMSETDAARWSAEIIPVVLALGQGLVLQRTIVPDFDRERFLTAVDDLFTAPPAAGP